LQLALCLGAIDVAVTAGEPGVDPPGDHAARVVGDEHRPDGGARRRSGRWGLHPEQTVSDRFALEDAGAAYALADAAQRGKVAITMS
jgi:hypothetical protein